MATGSRPGAAGAPREERQAWAFALPAAAVIALVALVPLARAAWDSLFAIDARMPWLGTPFAGAANYAEALADARFLAAMARTAAFTAASVSLEMVLGLAVALVLHGAVRGRGALRAALLLPWAIPTVVAALVWRFAFEGTAGWLGHVPVWLGLAGEPVVWLASPMGAWVPILLADVWKTTPFVALLLLAGLQGIDPALYEAARMDGAGFWRQLRHVTLPLLRPALLVALLFRLLDALRIFDLVYVVTGGGPGTATETVAVYTFQTLLQHLRFGYGSALSVLVFLATFLVGLLFVRALAPGREREA